ncbi:tyrosine-type recombinase/integrase [Methylomonas sp. 11b]|uniref:tyrosine-type recombinase/integrase n=1 Tax=Methylomonas sp. 11b TaxID=1168169 RepID=UPI00047A761B|nr:site-specific integrase [Methylomonas sp. 11b]
MTNDSSLPLTHDHAVRSRVALMVYLDNLAPSGRRSMRSLLQRAGRLLAWSGTVEDMPWLSLRYQQLMQLRSALRQADLSINTVNTCLAAIRGVLKAGFLLGDYPAEDWQRIQALNSVRGKVLPAGRQLATREIHRLLAICEQDKAALVGQRDAAILTLLVFAGLRRSEVVSLCVNDYVPRNGLLLIREGKGQKPRELQLPAQARQALKRWLHQRGGVPGPLFCQLAKTQRCSDQDHVQQQRGSLGCLPTEPINAHQVYALLKRRCRQAKLKPCTPHDLRRTFISKLLEQGVDFNTTRQLAGHEHLQTTALYDRRTVKTQRQAMANFRL